MQNLRFGVNYVPSRNWWYSWLDWDAASIAHDLAAIANLKMDHVRIHCVWPYFQPNPGYVSDTALGRLAELLDLADQYQLDVSIAVLNGWLSGFAFLPAWLHGHNIFTDPMAVDAEQRLFEAIADRIGDHPRFMGFDLGNELGVLHEHGSPAKSAEVDRWQAEMLAWCEAIVPGKLHVNGVDHRHWFDNAGFSRSALATAGSMTSLHTWAYWTGIQERYGPMGTGTLHLAEYSIELARAYHNDLNRPVWIQEFGATGRWSTPVEKIPDFAEQIIRNAATCESVWGFTWWCSHDLNPSLKGFIPGEYTLGLLTHLNQTKPTGQRVAQLIEEIQGQPIKPAKRPVALVLPDDLFTHSRDTIWRFVDAYMRLIEDGLRPAIVLESRVSDTQYLKTRSIAELKTFSISGQ